MKDRDPSFDLGRILILSENMLDFPIFERQNCSMKNLPNWFKNLSVDERDEYLEQLALNLEQIYDQIHECILIARGHDDLNESHY